VDLGEINFTYFLLEVALQKRLLSGKIHSYDIVTYPSALYFSPYRPVISAYSCFMAGMIDNSYGKTCHASEYRDVFALLRGIGASASNRVALVINY